VNQKAHAFGLYDIIGNVWQWVEDAYHDSYEGAPSDGSAWTEGVETSRRVDRGRSWSNDARELRAAFRVRGDNAPDVWDNILGFRIARTLSP
jgi:formylglycine-generating enzyme required for sulfatase activity